MKSIHIVGFAGSLRKKSYNRSLLRGAQDLLPDGATLEIISIDEIPLFNQDVEDLGDPEPVKVFKEKIRQADALLIATPEYNYSVSGVLKNAFDWASRPPGQSVLTGKPTAIMGASPGQFGTVRAQLHLRQSLLDVNAQTVNKPEVLINHAAQKFDADGNLIDEKARQLIRALLDALVQTARR
ncbi:MAG TPA: NAD(P)H-dependent oxidoreductase [Ktedonobacteraceae bacterium]|nr:NAD(P)H-dependent oxidoreductase [Ktedonobacteraceae bacterium]